MLNTTTLFNTLFDIGELLKHEAPKRLWNAISKPSSPLPSTRTELSELLRRYHANKSFIDTYTSWWYEMPLFHKSLIISSIISVSGLIGMIVGMTIPLIICVTGILYFTHKIMTEHETHRHQQIERFVVQSQALLQQLDNMMKQFEKIQSEMNLAQIQIFAQAEELSKHNAIIAQHNESLAEAHQSIRLEIEMMHTHEALRQAINKQVLAVVSELHQDAQSTQSEFTNTKEKLAELTSTFDQFTQSTTLMHNSAKDIQAIAQKVHEKIQQLSTSERNTHLQSDQRSVRNNQLLTRAHALLRRRNDVESEVTESNSTNKAG